VQPRAIDVCQLITQMRGMLERALRGDIELRLEFEEQGCTALADRSELDLAILNIAVNARDAMQHGGVFTISVKIVHLGAQPESNGIAGDFVAIRFTDTGSGIDPEHLPRIFEPYFTTKREERGTGLGLSQVYGFAKQAGGHVAIDSSPKRGTTVTLFLPRAFGPEAVAMESQRSPSAAAASRSVLLVEDDDSVALVLTDMLRDLGHRVRRAARADEALSLLASERSIDMVVSDILMPGGMSGLELARRLRSERPDLPVLLITGYSGKVQEVANEGFEVVKKPFEPEALAAALARMEKRGEDALMERHEPAPDA
jgi:CheY-like chemotaxis protein